MRKVTENGIWNGYNDIVMDVVLNFGLEDLGHRMLGMRIYIYIHIWIQTGHK